MGNSITRQLGLAQCCSRAVGEISRRHPDNIIMIPSSEDLGHSFCYIRPEPPPPHEASSSSSSPSSSPCCRSTTTFSLISGASISANTSTPLSTSLTDSYSSYIADFDKAPSAFESSSLFFSVPLEPVPRSSVSGSSPVENGFMSGPIERAFYSGSIDRVVPEQSPLECSLSFHEASTYQMSKKQKLTRFFRKVIRKTLSSSGHRGPCPGKKSDCPYGGLESSEFPILSPGPHQVSEGIQWAQGRAGEDRMHVVISDDNGWVFVGIYDGFNGPDAPDFLISNLYDNIQEELKGFLWSSNLEREDKAADGNRGIDHLRVLRALSSALKKTEAAFLKLADQMVMENPELALMGSCVLVMLMKGEDVYLMNVGDSRAVLARKPEPETDTCQTYRGEEEFDGFPTLASIQLTRDHSTYIREEVQRIKKAHPNDASAVTNDRVKGYLKVTRAFGAGFLKQPKWNDALLEMFRIDYIGSSPYITCFPSLSHHRLGPADKFLILSSDGLNQYFTNQEAITAVESFLDSFPEGDPAKHLIEKVLLRAAKKAGMNFHELLGIPQGDRRRYHDDVSVIIISLERRIWRSSL
ncbi:hypothetical protein SAY87_027899 [Trapa incisa]|uniref:PPM-type phosphatase domain-containing protein n=1 Tax=Trapa incisa TaxID=236973 RepID=A0AAN7QRK2_9MYRT|nr:hypothetical protein SAY87_027899 [Trapa incisa]